MDIVDVLKRAVSLAAAAWGEVLLLAAIGIAGICGALVLFPDGEPGLLTRAAISAAHALWSAFAAVILFNAFENTRREDQAEFPIGELATLTVSMAALTWCINALVGIGSSLCVVPGIIVSVGLMLGQIIYYKERPGIFRAISESWTQTSGVRFDLFIMLLIVYIPMFVIGGMVAFGAWSAAGVGAALVSGNASGPGMFTLLGLGAAIGALMTGALSLGRAIEFVVYETVVVVPRPTVPTDPGPIPVGAFPPLASTGGDWKPVERPAPAPITVDSEIVFGVDEDNGEDGGY